MLKKGDMMIIWNEYMNKVAPIYHILYVIPSNIL